MGFLFVRIRNRTPTLQAVLTMGRLTPSFTSFLTFLFRNVGDRAFLACVSPPGFSLLFYLYPSLPPSSSHSIRVRDLSPAQRGSESKVQLPQPAIFGSRRILIQFPVPHTELFLSLGVGATPTELFEALSNLRGYFGLTRLEFQAPDPSLDDSSQMEAIHALSGAVIHMSLLTYLSIPGNFVTEALLLHLSLLPRLQELVISPAFMTHSLLGRERHGFASLRSLDIPNGSFLHQFLAYPIQDLETLKVRDLDPNAISIIARRLSNLRRLHIKGQDFPTSKIFVLGACFQLEEITISTQHPLGMDDLDLHRFRAMFRNLRSLSITIWGFSGGTESHHTTHSREGSEASWVVETNGAGHGV